MKKIMSLFLALVMLVGVALPSVAMAAEEKTNKVTLHKILMTKEDLQAKKVTVGTGDKAVTKVVVQRKTQDGKIEYYDGNNAKLDETTDKAYIDGFAKSTDYVFPGTTGQNGTEYVGESLQNGLKGYFGQSADEIANVFFAVQKKVGNDWKYIDKTGTALTNQDPKTDGFATQTNILAGKTTASGLELDTSNLEQKNTEYRIVEIVGLSTYKSADGKLLAAKKAVPVIITLPLTNENGVVKEAHVYPKNTEEKPQIDKNFGKENSLKEVKKDNKDLSTETGTGKNPVVSPTAGADYDNYQKEKARVTAELGKEVPFEVKTKIQAGSQYKNLNWKDTMTNGLTLDAESIELKTDQDGKKPLLEKETDYKIKADDRGFSLYLTKTGFDKLNAITHPETGEGKDVEFTITYKATVNKNAVQDIPEKNDIKLEYSNNPKKEKEETPVTPSEGKLNVTKTWVKKDANEEVQVVYTLRNNDTNNPITAAVMLNGKEANNTVFDLGNGITFKVTGAYAGTFEGLTGTGWTISERVAGYNEAIVGTTGAAAITNTKDEENPTPLNPTEPEVVNYGKKFVKADKNTGERLEGAEFVVKNGDGKFLALKGLDTTKGEGQALEIAKENYTKAIETWNKAVAANEKLPADKKVDDTKLSVKITVKSINNGAEESKEGTLIGKTAAEARIKELKDAYFAAYEKAANAYEWVDSKDAANVVKLVSDVNGKFEIKGLEEGDYKIVEVKAPEGYALPSNTEFEFRAEKDSYTTGNVVYEGTEAVVDNAQGSDAMRVNNNKVSIPQTGGIGTVIFTAVGIALMAGAYVAMRKRTAEEN